MRVGEEGSKTFAGVKNYLLVPNILGGDVNRSGGNKTFGGAKMAKLFSRGGGGEELQNIINIQTWLTFNWV